MFIHPLDKLELKYLNRKERLNENFKWTKEDVRKVLELNGGLLDLQNALEAKVKSAYETFSRLEKGGLSFLHGFKVVGTIGFEKEILRKSFETENPTKKQEKIFEKWHRIAEFSSGEIGAWQLVFDSLAGDFMPLSKIRLSRKEKSYWLLDLPEEAGDVEFCSYFSHFIKYNKTFSNQDLAECTIKDFEMDVEVVLNYDVSELRKFQGGFPCRDECSDFARNIIEERCRALNENFEWSEKNVRKILEVNGWLWKMTGELKNDFAELGGALSDLAKKNPDFKNFMIEGQIQYHGSKANDIASLELQKEMAMRAGFFYWTLTCGNGRPASDSIHEKEDLNWNFEIFRHHLSEEQQKIKFHYLMHALFVDDSIFSFEDLVRMREEDFKICMEIRWTGEE